MPAGVLGSFAQVGWLVVSAFAVSPWFFCWECNPKSRHLIVALHCEALECQEVWQSFACIGRLFFGVPSLLIAVFLFLLVFFKCCNQEQAGGVRIVYTGRLIVSGLIAAPHWLTIVFVLLCFFWMQSGSRQLISYTRGHWDTRRSGVIYTGSLIVDFVCCCTALVFCREAIWEQAVFSTRRYCNASRHCDHSHR